MRKVLIFIGVICVGIGCGEVNSNSQVNLNTSGVIEKKEESSQVKKDFEEFLIKAKKIQEGKDE
mgnify:CR=1 FL=1